MREVSWDVGVFACQSGSSLVQKQEMCNQSLKKNHSNSTGAANRKHSGMFLKIMIFVWKHHKGLSAKIDTGLVNLPGAVDHVITINESWKIFTIVAEFDVLSQLDRSTKAQDFNPRNDPEHYFV